MARHLPAAATSSPAPPPIGRPPLIRRVWRSMVLRGPVVPRTDRDRAFVTVHILLLHLRPVRVPARTIRFTHTFGLGGSSLVLVTILAATGIGEAGATEPEKVLFLPHLLMREVAMALVITAVVIVLGAVFGAPLGAPANPGMSPNPAKAPWYFLGFQELLVHFHPVVAIVVIPLAGAVGLLLLPYVTADDEPAGAWFLSDRGWRAARVSALVALVVTPAAVVVHEVASRRWPGGTTWLTGGVLPLAVIAAGTFAFLRVSKTRFALTRNETVQAAVVLGGVAFAVLTMVGIWFRGPGMSLVWPWNR